MLYITKQEINFISNNGIVSNTLPFGTYSIKTSMERGIWLEINEMTPPIDTVGLSQEARRIMNKTWKTSDGNCSIMLSGVSGNGKTRTAFNVANDLKLPVILIQGQSSNLILDVLKHIENDVMLLYDEIEKHYDGENQVSSSDLLLFLDGLKTSTRIYHVFTGNEVEKLNKYFFNRPGRILFNFQFNSLKAEVAFDFIKNQITVTNEDRLKEYLNRISDLSYDICQNIINIISRFGDDYVNVLNYLNVRIGETRYNLMVKKDNYYSIEDQANQDQLYKRFEYTIKENKYHFYIQTNKKIKDMEFDKNGEYKIKSIEEIKLVDHYSENDDDESNRMNDNNALKIVENHLLRNDVHIKRTFIPNSTNYNVLAY